MSNPVDLNENPQQWINRAYIFVRSQNAAALNLLLNARGIVYQATSSNQAGILEYDLVLDFDQYNNFATTLSNSGVQAVLSREKIPITEAVPMYSQYNSNQTSVTITGTLASYGGGELLLRANTVGKTVYITQVNIDLSANGSTGQVTDGSLGVHRLDFSNGGAAGTINSISITFPTPVVFTIGVYLFLTVHIPVWDGAYTLSGWEE